VRQTLKKKLEYHYKYFDKTKISPDPLEFPKRFSKPDDIELSAFISSIFAYGNIKQIMKILNAIHGIMDNKPKKFIVKYSINEWNKIFTDVKYRFYSAEDITILFYVLNKVYLEYGSLKNLFLQNCSQNAPTIKKSLTSFSTALLAIASEKRELTTGTKFMFPLPSKGSTCKRMNLFLRWMVRKDELDFGIWNEVKSSQLIIPVDTHIAKISKQLKLTVLKNPTWKMAEEITNRLKAFDKNDPVKYDFAICHIGMRNMKF